MKLTIDTKEDSFEDIKKVVHLLTEILQRKESSGSSVFDAPADAGTAGLMSLFNEPEQAMQSQASSPSASSTSNEPPFNSVMGLFNKTEEKKEEKDDDMPGMMVY